MQYIRVDANEVIGTGHVMRCLSIADEYRKRDEETTFIVADKYAETMILEHGYESICLGSVWNCLDGEVDKIIRVIKKRNITKLIIDSYFVTEAYLKKIRNYTKTVYIDDIDRYIYPVDILINYNIYAESLDYISRYNHEEENTRFALGSKYVPLRTEFSAVKKKIVDRARKILLTSGGTDPDNFLGKILKKIYEQSWFDNFEYYVIIGRFNEHQKLLESEWGNFPNIRLLSNVSNMSEYMILCDIAITAGGVTAYELCACGIPSILYTLADNQWMIAQTLSDMGIIPWVGDMRQNLQNCLNSIIRHIVFLRDNVDFRKEISVKMQNVVDGNGCRRIVDFINE